MEANKQDQSKKKLPKKSVPVIRQTLTSYKRMLNANPLLKYEAEGIDVQKILASKSASTSMSNNGPDNSSKVPSESKSQMDLFKKPKPTKPLQRSQSVKTRPVSTFSSLTGNSSNTRNNLISGNCFGSQSSSYKKQTSLDLSRQSSIGFNPCNDVLSSTKLDIHNSLSSNVSNKLGDTKNPKVNTSQSTLNAKPKCHVLNAQGKKIQKKVENVKPDSTSNKADTAVTTSDKPLRKSLSSGHINKMKGKPFDPSTAYVHSSNMTKSHEDISCGEDPNVKFPFSPILEESQTREQSYIFRTPSAYERRSLSRFTPKSLNRRSTGLRASTPTAADLQKRLNDWLTKRGKRLSNFQHLKCFGLHHQQIQAAQDEDENKENIEIEDKGSYEDLQIAGIDKNEEKEEENKLQNLNEEEIGKVAKEALVQLQHLVKDGYPREQCECWLSLMKNKYKHIEEEPEYWECRATIEQSVGNIQNAVECYKTAIIQGAEVKTVDQSLDNLLQKFSLLHINTNKNKVEKCPTDKERERIVRDARNVFKSSIIQFAVQERKLKRNVKKESTEPDRIKFTVTPVRRSTRLSRSAYTSTPGVKICSSLNEIDADINFEKNKALC